jgi:hypothetical protein
VFRLQQLQWQLQLLRQQLLAFRQLLLQQLQWQLQLLRQQLLAQCQLLLQQLLVQRQLLLQQLLVQRQLLLQQLLVQRQLLLQQLLVQRQQALARRGQAGPVQGSFSRSALVVPLSLCPLLSPHNPSATMPARPPPCFSTANKGEGLGVMKF